MTSKRSGQGDAAAKDAQNAISSTTSVPSAEPLESRLRRRFSVHLAQAERDWPGLAVAAQSSEKSSEKSTAKSDRLSGRTRGGGIWPRLALPVVGAVVIAIVAVAGMGLVSKPTRPGGGGGVPTEIDGQHVYRIDEGVLGLAGSFLLAGYVPGENVSGCIAPQFDLQPENDLLGSCGIPVLLSGPDSGEGVTLAPKASLVWSPWSGLPVVMRVHTHDSEAAQCSADMRPTCERSVVAEAVVWPVIPPTLNGGKVYRASDQPDFPTSGSFLLGGRVNTPDLIPPCAIDMPSVEGELIPYCVWTSIDGIEMAPKSAGLDTLSKNELVVARVHINDPDAAGCSEASRGECAAAVVVESIVWRDDSLLSLSTPSPVLSTPYPGDSLEASPWSSTAVASGPASSGPGIEYGPDGVPSRYNGESIARATSLPTGSNFLLAGVLGQDTTCPVPTELLAKPPSCGYWMVDGLRVGTQVNLPASAIGMVVVVRVERSSVIGTCNEGACPRTAILVVTELVLTISQSSTVSPQPPGAVSLPPAATPAVPVPPTPPSGT